MVVMLDWADMAALEAALGSEAGQRAADDAMKNLTRYATFRGMILRLEAAYRSRRARSRKAMTSRTRTSTASPL